MNKNIFMNLILLVGLLLVGGFAVGTANPEWVRVVDLSEGDYIAVPDYETGSIKYEKITSIRQHEPGRVYDMEIEGTHNFIANDIIAHNTNRFFQYRAVFTSNSTETPVLEEVNVTYASTPFEGDQGGHYAQLVIWDDSDDSTVYANYTKFYANYTNATSGASVNGTGVYCTWRHNKTGSWGGAVNMSFNATTFGYELVADGGYICNSTECHRDGMPVGNYSFNVSCFDSSTGFTNLTIADAVSVSEYATSLTLVNDSSKSVGESVMFYANYSADDMLIGGVGLNRGEIGRVVWNTTDLDTNGYNNGYSIAFADLDEDGRKDEVVVGPDGDLFGFYENGTQFWGTMLEGVSTFKTRQITIGDFDNDTFDNDIAIVRSRGHVQVFNRTGDSVWQSADLGAGVTIHIFDHEGDGLKNDIVFREEGILAVYNTTGGSSWTNIWNVSLAGSAGAEIKSSDVDGDGVEDILINMRTAGHAFLYSGSNGSLIFNVTGVNRPYSVGFMDSDHDGNKDEVIISSRYNAYVFNWNGTYGSTYNTSDAIFSVTTTASYVYETWAGDLDGDGWEDDIVFGDTDNLRIYDNDTQVGLYSDSGLNIQYSLDVLDINNDGELEIVVGTNDGVIYIFNRTGSLLWEYTIGLGVIGSDYGSSPGVDMSDINNDGILDVAVSSSWGYAHILQDVTCTANFNDSNSYNMTWNGTSNLWEMNRTFSSAASYDWNVSCEKGGYVSQVDSSTLSISSLNVSHSPSSPYANYTRVIAEFDDSAGNCSLKFNATGSWSSWYNMSWNATLGGFNVVADNGYICNSSECHMRSMPVGSYSYNVTCENAIGEEVSAVSAISVQEYSTSLVLENDTTKSVGESVMFYANYSADTMVIGGAGLDRSEIGRVVWNTTDLGSLRAVAFIDLNNDGKKDEIAVGDYASGIVYGYYPNGTQIWNLSIGDYNSNSIDELAIGDLDNDGYENEIAIYNTPTYEKTYLKVINETGDLVWSTGDIGSGWGGVNEIGDLDNDGNKDDIAVAGNGEIFVYDGSGTQLWNSTFPSGLASEITIGDIDNDGFEDDVIIGTYVGDVIVFNNSGGQIWNKTDFGSNVNAISVGDLDNDGNKDDIAILINNYATVYAYNESGNQIWSYDFSNSGDYTHYEVLVTDLDNDNRDEVVVGLYGRIAVLNNTGNLSWEFSEPTDDIFSISVGDINGDGKIEIVAGGVDDIVWVFNVTGSLLWKYDIGLGDIGFETGSSPAIDILDINNDGILDIAVASHDGYAHILQDTTCKIQFEDEASTFYNETGSALDEDLVLLMHMDNDSGYGENDTVVYDFSGNGNNGSVENDTTWNSSGKYGGGFEFDGIDDYISVSDVSYTNKLSVSAWAKAGSLTTEYEYIVGEYPGWILSRCNKTSSCGAGNENRIRFMINSGSEVNAFADNVLDTAWHHYLGVYDGSTVKLYVDGVLTDTENQSGNIDSSGSTRIGCYYGDTSHEDFNWDGSIDEVAIWNRTLSAEEVWEAYNAGAEKHDMDWNSTLNKWEYNRTFSTNESVDYGVRCEKGGYASQVSSSSLLIDDGAPRWSANETNLTTTTPSGDSVYFNVTLSDSSPDDYVFSWYNGTVWANDSAVAYSDGEEVSVVKTINVDGDSGQINWTWYVNDSYNGNLNVTDEWSVGVDNWNPRIGWASPTLANGSWTPNSSVEINVSINETNLEVVKWNWNGTNESIFWIDGDVIEANFTNLSTLSLLTINDGSNSIDLFNDSSLVLALSFDNLSALGENSTHVFDWSGNGNNGTMMGDPVWNSTGKYGGAFELDQIDDYVNVPYSSDFNFSYANFTISVWYMYREHPPTYTYPFAQGNRADGAGNTFSMGKYDSNDWYFMYRNRSDSYFLKGFATTENTLGTWYNIVLTYNGSNYYIYENGAYKTGDSNTGGFYDSGYNMTFGANLNGGGYVNGSIDEVRIYDRYFTSSEVATFYKSNLRKYDTDSWNVYVNQSGNFNLTYFLEGSRNDTIDFFKIDADEYWLNVNKSSLTDGDYTYYVSAKDSAGNENLTTVRSVSVDTTYPEIGYTTGTEADGANVSQNWIFVNVSVNETGEDSIVFNLYNSDSSLNASQTFPSELPDSQAVNSVFNMTGNVLLMHMNNDSGYGENGTHVFDFSGEGNNGSVYDNASFTTGGKLGAGAFEFDGDGDYVDCGNDSSLEFPIGSFSLAMWVKLPDSLSDAYLLFYGDTADEWYAIDYYSGGDVLRFSIDDDATKTDIVTATGLSDNSWHHLVSVRDIVSDVIRLYVDGIEVDSDTDNTGNISNPTYKNVYLGKRTSSGSSSTYFNGSIDEVAIWNRTLSVTEIEEMYNWSRTRYRHNFTSLDDAVYKYNVTLFDAAGNENSTGTRTVTLDTTYPAIDYTTPPTPVDNANLSQDYLTINVSVTEINADNITYYLYNSDDSLNASQVFPSELPDSQAVNSVFNMTGNVLLLHMNNDSGYGENDTVVYDFSGVGNNGTVTDASFTTGGKLGGGFEFDGDGDYISISDDDDFNFGLEFTIALWYYPKDTSPVQHIAMFAKRTPTENKGNFQFGTGYTGVENGDDLAVRVYSGSGSSVNDLLASDVLTTNAWNYIVFIGNSNGSTVNNITSYVNGINVSNQIVLTNPIYNTSDVISLAFNGQDDYDTCSLDEVAIWNRSLSATEISELYNASKVKYEYNITSLDDAVYKYNVTLVDAAGNENSTGTRTVTLDTTYPAIDYNTPPTPADNSNLSQDYLTINVSVTEVNAENVTYYLYNSDDSLNASQTFPSELPDSQAVNSVFNMTGNVLLMHMNNDSDYGENDTRVFDFSGNGNNGSVTGANWSSSGKLGGGFEFDGVDNRINYPLLNFGDEFTISVWTYPVWTDNIKTIINNKDGSNGETDGFNLVINNWETSNRRITFSTGNGGSQNSASTNTGQIIESQWNHIAVVVNRTNGSAIIYHNGLNVTTDSSILTDFKINDSWELGYMDTEYYFNGTMDEVAIWNRSLSASEISEMYNLSKVKYQYNITSLDDAVYKYNVTLFDAAGNSNSTSTRTVTLDTTYPTIDYNTPPTPADNANLSQDYLTINVSVTEINADNITYYLYNSDDSLNASQVFPSELPDSQAVNSVFNMTGNVLLLHMNNDSGYGENDTVVYDFSGNGNNGTSTFNGTGGMTASGKLGGGAFFDGDGDYVDIPDTVIGNFSWTISLWINPKVDGSVADTYAIGSDYSPVRTYIGVKGGNYWFYVGSSGDNLGSSVVLDEWVNLVVVYNGSSVAMYENGNNTVTDLSVSFTAVPSEFNIGSYSLASGWWNGSIDEVAIWNRSLSATEISEMYNLSKVKYQYNITSLDDAVYKYNVTLFDAAGNSNSTSTRTVTLDDTAPVISIVSPQNSSSYYTAVVDFNVSIEENLLSTESCWFSLDGAANVSMTEFNSSYFNYTKSDMTHGEHNVTFWCNDSLNNLGTATLLNVDIVLLDLTVSDVTVPGTVYSNSTFIEINISNSAPPNATGVNVSCYIDGVMFDSKNLSLVEGYGYYVTNCTLDTTAGLNRSLNVTVDPANAHPESNESNNDWTTYIDVLGKVDLDAYDQEDDSENKAGWLSEVERLPGEMEYFFANYTMDNSSVIENASCNVTFSGGSEGGTFNLSYNDSASLYYYNKTFDYAGNYSWTTSCSKIGYESLSGTGVERVRIPLFNQTSLGLTTGKITVNHDENVNLSVNLTSSIDSSNSGYNISGVWANIVMPNTTSLNHSLSGSALGGMWNLTYSNLGILGTYSIDYFANLTNSFNVVKLVENNFSVENTSILIDVGSEANTTNVVNVGGTIRRYNGTDYTNIANNLFTIKLNSVLVSSDSSASTNFTNGTGDGNVNMSVGNLRLNLTSEGDLMSYTDDYVTTGYTSDAESYNDVGWVSGHLFDINTMSGNVGNITYRFSAVTKFYNASAYMSIAGAEVGGGNDTIYYSFDNVTWTLLVNTTSTGRVGGTIPSVQGESEFYVRFGSDKTAGDNPVSSIEINYTNYNYSSSGNHTSGVINLANVTYTTLKWDETLNGGTTKVQLRESDDGSSWDAWGSNYTNHLTNDITSLSKDYLQYRVWLGATNLSRTPIVQGVNISYFNASTNSTGGYDYNVTIPTDSLGSLDLEVEVVQNPTTGIVGLNSTLMDVWAETSTPYTIVENYTSESNYSVHVNWTRDDTGALINGTFNITISNSTMDASHTCSGVSQCVASWLVPTNLSHGNYTINISAHNESAYYRNASAGFNDYLEEKNTTGNLYVVNKSITDYSFGSEYPFYWNVTVNNTGSASMPDLYVFDYEGARGSAIDSVVEVTPCSKLYPGEQCNATMLVTLKSVAEPGSYLISWRANWTDNDGSIAGGADYISYTDMYVIIVGNASMELSRYTENLTVQHNSSESFSFFVNATGSDAVTIVDTSFVEGNLTANDYNLSSSWVSVLSTNPIASIPAGDASSVSIQVDVPVQTAPGNYSGTINVSAGSGGAESLNLTVVVPVNGSWYLTPSANFTYNRSFSLNTAGEIGNFTLTNLGNINMTMNVSYSNSGTYDYTALGTALFEEDYNVSGLITNPSLVNVTKGENTTITLYQKGDSNPRIDVGIILEFYNASATPATFIIEDAWTIEEQDPNITGVWFLLDDVSGSIAEQFKNVTTKFRATDDVALNTSGAKINLSWSGGATQIDADAMLISGEYELSGADYVVLNYSGNYSPTTSGLYTVTATVLDESGNPYTSGEYTFTSYGTTTVGLDQNYSSKTVGKVDLNNAAEIYVNYTINNSGLVTAYSPTLTFVKNSTIEIDNYTFSNLSSGSVDSYVIQMNVSELTPPGVYNVSVTLTWTNPNTGTDTDTAVFSITVEENSSIAHLPSTIVTGVNSGEVNSSVLQINNTGNTVLSSMNLDCYTGTLCNGMTVSFNNSGFQIGLNDSTTINVTLTAPVGLPADNYVGTINVSATGFSDTIEIQATVPTSKTWSVSPISINVTKGAEISDNLQTIIINNTGNVNMTWNLGTTNSTLFSPNSSQLMVPLNTATPFMVNYTAPSEEGNYIAKITIENLDGAANPTQINVTINMSVTALIVDIISPTASSPLENVSAGQNISVLVNATYGVTNITNSSTWNVTIGSGSCSGLNSTYSSLTNRWNLSCTVPSIPDGLTYNLTVELTHSSYGTKEDFEDNAISYTDLTYPTFDITRNHVNLGGNINLEVNVTDNVAVENVTGVLTYPNSTTINLSFTLSAGLYINNSFALDLAGEYLVNYTANDSTGNENSSVDWFEVYDKYDWNVSLLDYASSAVSSVNISLKRPDTTTVLLSNVTNTSGKATLNVNRRFYDLSALISNDEVIVENVNFSNITDSNMSFNLHRIGGESVLEIITLYKPFIGLASNSTELGGNAVDLIFNYSGYSYRDNGLGLSVIKCSVWNYTDRSCSGSWSLVGDYTNRNLDEQTIPGNSTGFNNVAYFLADNMCGNGACETAYGETTTTCSADCKDTTPGGTTIISSGGGGGSSSSGLSAADLAKIEDIVKSYLNIGGVNLETTSIYKELFAGEVGTVRIKLRNTRDVGTTISLKVTGEIQPLIFFESNSIELGANEARDMIMKIVAPKFAKVGEYNGNLMINSKGEDGSIPVTIKILSPEGKLLDVKIQPLTSSVPPGGILRLQTDLLNLGKTKRVDVQFDLQLIDLETGETVTRAEESFAVETSISTIKNLTIPEDIPVGRYMVKAVAYYSNIELDGTMQASSIAYVNIQHNFFIRKLFGIPMWMYLGILLLIGFAIGIYYFLRWKEFQKRRFKSKVELNKLPQASSHSGFVGMVAETGIRAFVDMNKLQMHTLIAGATGSGKTIAAQDMIEEALTKKKSVILFDPTAQWTGFLRKCEDAKMLKRYKYFGVKTKDAKSFNGSIQTIHDPYEMIDIKKYMNRPGEITIFNISHLTPKEMDIIVASTIEQIFKSEPEESQELKTLIVYDEVHRLLPKFGGSGQGFVQLERGAREFRKWGVGLFLISQVLSDFIGEIKANIGTEVQMGTRYEGDLDRISMKYGDDVLKSVVKEPIGTGMVVNAEYNSGRPYFVSFRPILHSTKRLSNEELVKYEKYFMEIEDLEYQSMQLRKLKVDTMDLELEIKLSKAKIKSGQFQMADMYLESLRPKVEGQWKKVGKNPMHLVKKKLNKSEVVAGIEKAKVERAKYIKKNPQEKVSFDQEILDIKKSVGEEKKKGKDTSALEIKIEGLKERLKPFKGKISSKDSEGIEKEIDSLRKEVSDFEKQTRVEASTKKVAEK
ncbi:VCBS repeat-containing protein [Candidatus Pacearchaeota archaeon]|nr:VCBS repeat-containing protein [Candidatus Pacearchaeota archaeon]